MESNLFMGLMSGTSCDGLDIAVVEVGKSIKFITGQTVKYPARLANELKTISRGIACTPMALAQFEVAITQFWGQAVIKFCQAQAIALKDILAVGMHGHTICHGPGGATPYSWQIGKPYELASILQIPIVYDFRSADIALGGQGAPLLPIFHHKLFADNLRSRAIVNIGGIANITIMPRGHSQPSQGFDTGPGNVLLDRWVHKHLGVEFDQDGQWGQTGSVIEPLLAVFYNDPYFSASDPKSTGLEYFNLNWLDKHDLSQYQPCDVQATLEQLTALSIGDALSLHLPDCNDLIVVGGGMKNASLLNRLRSVIPDRVAFIHSKDLDVDADLLEAMGFAWFAAERVNRRAMEWHGLTGAERATYAGTIVDIE